MKIEIVNRGIGTSLRGYSVQATWKEPFEDLFEIAVHHVRFAHPRDAHRLAERVREAVKSAYPKSPATVLNAAHWAWESSAYRTCADCAKAAPAVEFRTASAAALAADAAQD